MNQAPPPPTLPDRNSVLKTIVAYVQDMECSILILESIERHSAKAMLEIPAHSVCVKAISRGFDNGVRPWAYLEWTEGDSKVSAFFKITDKFVPCSTLLIYKTHSAATARSMTFEWIVAEIGHLKELLYVAQNYLQWQQTQGPMFPELSSNFERYDLLTKYQYRTLACKY